MYIYNPETVIPRYPFEADPLTGNKMFRIVRNDCIVNYRRSDLLVPHRKDYYFFAFVKKGNSRHWIDMTPYTLKADTFYFTVPHQVHLKEEAEPLTGVTISFTKDFLAIEDNELLKNLPLIQNPHNGHELTLSGADLLFVEELLERVLAEYAAKNSWQQQMLQSYMKILLIYLSRLYTEQFSNASLFPGRLFLKKYLSKIDESFRETHDVAAYAGMMNVSSGHLSEVVKEQSGKSAITHIHERLMMEAKRLLFHTDYSIKEIAFELGFEDASYFNRFFKRIARLTPLEYRTTIREMYH